MASFLRGALMSNQQGPFIFLLRRKCSRLEVFVPKTWENVVPLRSDGKAGKSACKNKIILINQHQPEMDFRTFCSCVSAYRISHFQVVALTGHVRNFKSIALLHFLQRQKQKKQAWMSVF